VPSTAQDILSALLSLVFPTPCHGCRDLLDIHGRGAFCSRCWSAMERMPDRVCARCGWPFPQAASRGAEAPLCQRCRETRDQFQVARAALRYREGGMARAAILLGKHGSRRSLIRHLARLLAEEAPLHLALAEWDGLVPVPLHWMRRWQRGFNQAQVLAKAVGRRHGLPVVHGALRRIRPTPPQHGDPEARRANVRDAFSVTVPRRVAGRRLVLVDDVFTTGATANACAKVLLGAGAAAVAVLTLARVE
jgi:ComF family protein